MYFVYIVKSKKDNKYYTGITNNLRRRLKEHSRNKSSTPSTRNRGPFKLIFSERFKTRKEARAREKFWKSGKGRELRNKITKQV